MVATIRRAPKKQEGLSVGELLCYVHPTTTTTMHTTTDSGRQGVACHVMTFVAHVQRPRWFVLLLVVFTELRDMLPAMSGAPRCRVAPGAAAPAGSGAQPGRGARAGTVRNHKTSAFPQTDGLARFVTTRSVSGVPTGVAVAPRAWHAGFAQPPALCRGSIRHQVAPCDSSCTLGSMELTSAPVLMVAPSDA